MDPIPMELRLQELEVEAARCRPQVDRHAFACAGGEARIAAADSGNLNEPRSAAERVCELLQEALYRARKAGGNRIEEAVADVAL